MIGLTNQLAGHVDLHIVLSAADAWMAPFLHPSIDVLCSNAPRVSSIANIGAMVKLGRLVHNIGADIIHYQSGVVWEGLAPTWFTRARVITTVHDVVHHPHQLRNQFTPQVLMDRLALKSDALIVHGDCLRGMAERRYCGRLQRRPKSIATIAHPLILRYGTGRANSRSGRNVLLFGSLAQWKGIEVLMPAMVALLRRLPDARLKIAGPSSTPDYYRSLSPGTPNIELDIRRQSDDEVRKLFSWADLVVLPYIEASQSGVLHIANSFAVPVVASRVGALAESIEHGVNGLLVPAGNVDLLTDALFDLLSDAALRERIIANIEMRRDAEMQHNSIGAATSEFYDRLLREPAHLALS